MQKNFAGFNLGRVVEDLLGLAQQVRSSAGLGEAGQQQLEKLLRKMNLVTRDEFEAVRAIAIAARMQAEDVADHVGLAKAKNAKTTKTKAKTKAKPAKKPATKTASTIADDKKGHGQKTTRKKA